MRPIGTWGSNRISELYALHASEAVRLAYLLTGDRSLAEDLGQDAFIRVAGRLDHLRNADAFPAYLRRAVVNLCRMHFRRKQVEERYLSLERGASRVRDDDADIATVQAVRKAILILPYRQRAAIVLRFYADVPDEEIAQVLGCAVGTVRSLVSRGTTAIRESIERDVDD